MDSLNPFFIRFVIQIPKSCQTMKFWRLNPFFIRFVIQIFKQAFKQADRSGLNPFFIRFVIQI